MVSNNQISVAIDELFNRAKSANIQRFYLCLVDAVIFWHNSVPYRSVWDIDGWVTEQFSKYFLQVSGPLPPELASLEEKNFGIRLQLLAYSQLWECRSLKRLFHNLLRTIMDREYDTCIMSPKSSTGAFWNQVELDSKELGLKIAQVLTDLYDNARRNAFAHSDFVLPLTTDADYITFGHPMLRQKQSPSLKLDEWFSLFDCVQTFVTTVFRLRREAIQDLKRRLPYRIDTVNGDFTEPFLINLDRRGHWSLVSAR